MRKTLHLLSYNKVLSFIIIHIHLGRGFVVSPKNYRQVKKSKI